MENFKGHKRMIMVHILIGYLIISIIFIGLFIYKSNSIYKLDRETYDKISYYMIESGERDGYLDYEIEKIIDEHRNKQHQIENETIINGITGLLITVTIILTSVNKIIKNTKGIWTGLNSQKEIKDDYFDKENLMHTRLDEQNCNYQQINEMIKQICPSKEINKEIEEKDRLVEKILTLLMKQLTQVLDQTINFTNQINHDKNLLITEIQEIKKGIEQIGQVMIEKQSKKNTSNDEEISAAVEQINTATEEMGELLIEMEKKILHLSNNVDKYKNKP